MNWEQWFCANQACTVEAWMVRRDSAVSDLWWVAAHVDDQPFTVAATEPLCPRCGTTLCLTVAMTQQVGGDILEARPLREFARNLP
jgi:hypothetical protein